MKTLQGKITSAKMPNTVRVSIVKRWKHPLYGKIVRKTTSYACHYEAMELNEGDTVEIVECRPMSKTKKFKVSQLISKSGGAA